MQTKSKELILSAKGLNKRYGSYEVLRDLNLELEKGSILGLVGLNGSGKTTILNCLLGLQTANSGVISLLNFGPQTLHQSKGKIVGIFDSPSLHPNLTVRQNLEHASLLTATARTPKQVEKLLGIEKFAKFKLRKLSLGNKRRASIAHALIGNPDLIILDEPFNGLDAGGVDDVLALIRQLNETDGTSFLLSSHQLPYLENICSHIAILHHGKICLSDRIDNLLSSASSTIKLRTASPSSASSLIDSHPNIQILELDAQGYTTLSLTDMSSSELNRLLVESNVPVDELMVQRPSLKDLFQKITNERSE